MTKSAKGDIHSPVEMIIRNTYAIMNAAERNEIGNALIAVSKIPGMGKFIEKLPPKMQPVNITKEELEKRGIDMDEVDKDTVTLFRPKYVPKDNEIILYENGKPFVYYVDAQIRNAVLKLDVDTANTVTKILSYPARWLRAGATLSPEFSLRNPFRDQFTAYVYSQYGYKPFVDLFRGIAHMTGKTKTWQKFNASGAAHAALVSLDRNYLTQNYKELMGRRNVSNLIKNPLRSAQILSELMEEGTRVGEFARALKKEGGTLEATRKAGLAARDITLDFARVGAKTRSINAIYAFWNANVQGLDKLARELKYNPGRTLYRAAMSCTIPSVLLWAAQHDDPYYQEIPVWRRVLFWNVVTHKPDGSLAHIWSVPKPFELGLIFGSSFEMMLDAWKHEDPDMAKQFAESILNTLNPFGSMGLPTGLLPIVEVGANKSFYFDSPIVPRDKEGIDPYLQYSGETSEAVKWLAQKMKDVPGLKEIASPSKIEHLVLGYTAGVGRLALEGIDKAIKEASLIDVPPEPETEISDIPGIRAFAQRFPATNARSIEQFYDRYTKAQRKYETLATEKGIRQLPLMEGQARMVRGTVGRYDKELIQAKAELDQYTGAANILALGRRSLNYMYKSKELDPKAKTEARNRIIMNMINVARVTLGKQIMKSGGNGFDNVE
jgi:hypothetical protein